MRIVDLRKEQIDEDKNENLFGEIMDNKIIWIVTYCADGEEPVVTPFNNEDAATGCYRYFKSKYPICCIDKCEVFSSFYDGEKWTGDNSR